MFENDWMFCINSILSDTDNVQLRSFFEDLGSTYSIQKLFFGYEFKRYIYKRHKFAVFSFKTNASNDPLIFLSTPDVDNLVQILQEHNLSHLAKMVMQSPRPVGLTGAFEPCFI